MNPEETKNDINPDEAVKKELNLEDTIKDVISKKLEDGTVEALVEEKFQEGMKNALENIFRSYGDVTKTIEAKIKSVMVPYIESYDYSKYITKLDDVLVELLKSSALENKTLLENFKELMIKEDRESIQLSELFKEWQKYVAKNAKTDGLEVVFDGDPTYEDIEVTVEVEHDDGRNWSSFRYASVVFECEHDEDMNFMIRLSRWDRDKEQLWSLSYDNAYDIKSIRRLNQFEILLMKLNQAGVKLELDIEDDGAEVTLEATPEASFS